MNTCECERDNAVKQSFFANFGQKVKSFFTDPDRLTDILSCVFLFVFISFLFAVLLKINGIFPFGDVSMSSYDMLAQVAPFIEHFFDVIDGKSSLFYSFSIVGGADVFGTLAYCCVSPFTFVFLLFGKGNVYYATSVVLPLKIICVAISAYIYLRKRFNDLSPVLRVALALSYAFCGYLYVSNTYINWVDILIYLPVLAYGFRKLVSEGKKATFIVGLCLIIYTCFSIACFSLLVVYPLMISYCFIVVPKEKRQKSIVDLVVALCLSVAFSLPILIPALCAYLVSGRSAGLFNGLFNELKPDPLYYKVSYILTDGLTLFFTFAYLVKYGVKRPIDRFLLLAALFTLMPVLCDECCIMLNFGSYNSYALRFGFLNGFYFLFVAAKFLNGFPDENEDLAAPVSERLRHASKRKSLDPETQKILFSVLLSLVCVGALVGGYFLCVAAQGDKIEKWFSSRFAHSLGGLEVSVIVFAIVAIIGLLGSFLVYYRKIGVQFFAVILLIVVCGQSALYAENLVYGNKKEVTDFNRIGVLTDFIKEQEDGEYARVKMKGDYLTADMPFTLHTNAYSMFSSVINDKNIAPARFFAFGGNGSNTVKSYYGTFFGDCLFGNRYYITKSTATEKNYTAMHGYDKDENGNDLDIGEFRLYKNNYVFPHAFVTSGRIGNFSSGTLYDKYTVLVKSLGGIEEEVLESDASLRFTALGDGAFKLEYNRRETGCYFAVFNFDYAGNVKYTLGSGETKYDVENNSVQLHKFGSNYSNCILYFEDDSVTADVLKAGTTLYCVTDDAVKNISAKAQSRAGDIKLSSGNISVTVDAADGEYLFLNYVALPGHTATVNGKRVEIDDNLLGFMLVPLENGTNKVEIKYNSPYVKYAVFGLIAALLVGFAYFIFLKKFKSFGGIVCRVIEVAAVILCVAVVVVFMLFPLGVMLYKVVKLLITKIAALF